MPNLASKMASSTERLILLGASNVTRGFATAAALACGAWGDDVEIYAALGHGRSFGARSRVGFRALPGILECGIWGALEEHTGGVSRALIADVGNDILYGYSPEQIIAWLDEAIRRLQPLAGGIALMGLPMASIRLLKPVRFLFFRTLLVPACRLSLHQVRDRAEIVNAGLMQLAARHGARLVVPEPSWYGFDPVHIRRSAAKLAWQTLLGVPEQQFDSKIYRLEALRLYAMAPERRWLFGIEQISTQSGVRMKGGGRVWLY